MEDVHPEFTFNCREELDGHVNCVKLFLEQHVKHGVPYIPGSGDDRDQCAMTRSLYMVSDALFNSAWSTLLFARVPCCAHTRVGKEFAERQYSFLP